MKQIFCILETCLGCKSCELACAVEHSESKDLSKVLKDISLPKQRIFVQASKDGSYPLLCRHCQEPACILACMSGAITKDPETGAVKINKDKCLGCGMCIMSCPYCAVLKDHKKGITIKCDLCGDSVEPACVKACPTKSLVFYTIKEFEKKIKNGKKH